MIRYNRLPLPPQPFGIGLRLSLHRAGHIAVDTRHSQHILTWGAR